MTDKKSAQDNLAAGYATPAVVEPYSEKRARRVAGAHNPGYDAEADRLTSTVGDALPASVRLALGYHASAREAARKLNEEN